jgi:glycosyl transferase family 1
VLTSRPDTTPRVLLFSQRNIYEIEVWRASLREFEDIIVDVDAVDVLAPTPGRWHRHRKRIALRVGRDSNVIVNPGMPRIRLDRDYDLFFAICEKTSELLNLTALEGWNDRCRISACLVSELWVKEMPFFKSCLKMLAKFDYVFSYLSQSVEAINQAIPGRCLYLAPGVDTRLFMPDPKAARSIDVFSLGRRPEHLHQALLTAAHADKIFYVYDTINDLHAHDLGQHRLLVANIAKRSRYFVVYPAKWDSPQERGDQSEMGARYFEGAAAGTVLIGERPSTEQFDKTFFWPDAVVELPRDRHGIEEVMTEMDREPDRQDKVRRTNVVQALRRHDWVHRWETVLATAGLEPMPALVRRRERLADLAAVIEG